MAAQVRRARREYQSVTPPTRSPRGPFVTDIDRQLAELRKAAGPSRQELAAPQRDEDLESPSSALVRGSGNPFDVPDEPVEAPPIAMGNPFADQPMPRSEDLAGRGSAETIQPVAMKVAAKPAPEMTGVPDPTMIVDSDMLPSRFGVAAPTGKETRPPDADAAPNDEAPRAPAGGSAVRDLEGPGEAPWSFPAGMVIDPGDEGWQPQQDAGSELPAPPPPEVAEDQWQRPADFRIARRMTGESGPRAIPNVSWETGPEKPSQTGTPSAPVALLILCAAGLFALGAWARVRRRVTE